MVEGQTPRFVSAAEITRNFGAWQDRAAQGPLVVTHHGRPRCVMLSSEAYEAMTGGFGGAPGDEAERSAIAHALLAERIDGAFVALDAHARVVETNATAAALFGRTREHLAGHPLGEIAPWLGEGVAGAAIRRVLRSGEAARLSLHGDAPGERDYALHAFGWLEGAALIVRPIEADADVEAREADALALASALATHGAIGIARLTLRATIRRAEPGFAALTGFAPARLAGVRLVDLLALSSRAAAGEAIERALTGGGACVLDTRLLVDGGTEHHARLALAPIGEGCGIVGATVVATVG